jgi:WD40 repeat protein
MTTFDRLMKGGDKGEPVVAGKPEESLLWTLASGTESPRMPPKEAGAALPKEKVALIERWIKEGAKFDGPSPQTDLVAELRKRWQPPTPPAVYAYPSIVRSLAFRPGGKHVIVGGYHELLAWDLDAGKLERRIRTRAERTNAMVFLPDGQLVVAGGRPGQEGDVRIYDLEGGKPAVENGVAFVDGVDAKAGVLTRELMQTDDEILCLALSPDGKKLAAAGCDRIIRVWDIPSGFTLEQSIENHADWVFGLAFAPDSKHLLSSSRDKTAKVWDLAARESVLTFPDHQNGVYHVASSPDGKQAVSCGEDGQVRIWNAAGEGKQIRAGKQDKPVFKVLYHPKKPVLISCGADHSIRLWTPDNLQNRPLTGHSDWVYALALSPDGALAASGAWNGEVRIWKIDDASLVKAFQASPGGK